MAARKNNQRGCDAGEEREASGHNRWMAHIRSQTPKWAHYSALLLGGVGDFVSFILGNVGMADRIAIKARSRLYRLL